MNLSQLKDYYNKKPVEYTIRENYELVEDREYVPRFTLKNVKDIANIPINEPIKYSDAVMIKAIKYGMMFLINYKGEEDKHFSGHERVIYPMVLGRSTQGKVLLRGWHLNGWSVSNKRHIDKIWRLFRADRILSMTFTGSFYRLAPIGYNMNDKGMRGGIIAKRHKNIKSLTYLGVGGGGLMIPERSRLRLGPPHSQSHHQRLFPTQAGGFPTFGRCFGRLVDDQL